LADLRQINVNPISTLIGWTDLTQGTRIMDPDTAGLAVASGVIVFGLIILAICLIPLIFYLLSLQKAFARVAPERRELSPGMVWLMLIPLFNLVWHFILVAKLSNSLGKEFTARNSAVPGDNHGWTIGLVMCILACTSWIPILGFATGIAALVLWIIYWVKIAGYSSRLATPA